MTKAVFALLAVPLSTFISPVSLAQDWATFNGSMCQPFSAADVSSLRATNSGVFNRSADRTLRVICPVNRDAFEPGAGAKSIDVYIALRNAIDGVAFRCELYARTTFGGNPNSGSYQTASYYGAGDHEMFYSVATNSVIDETDTFVIDCKVPPKSRIYGVRTEER